MGCVGLSRYHLCVSARSDEHFDSRFVFFAAMDRILFVSKRHFYIKCIYEYSLKRTTVYIAVGILPGIFLVIF